MTQKLSIEFRLDAKLRREMAKRAEKGFGPIENFLYESAMGNVPQSVVVDKWLPDPETGKMVRCKVVEEIPPPVKDRVAAAKAWKEMVVDKRAADRKEASKPGEDPGSRRVTEAVRSVAERRRGQMTVVPGGKGT